MANEIVYNGIGPIWVIQCAQKCGSNFYTKCHKMALSKSQICSVLQHSIFEFFQGGFPNNFYPTKICRDVARRVQLCIEHNGGQFEHLQ
jgi:hypothetical protein